MALPEVLHGKYLKKLTTIGNLATVIPERSSSNLAKLQSDSTASMLSSSLARRTSQLILTDSVKFSPT